MAVHRCGRIPWPTPAHLNAKDVSVANHHPSPSRDPSEGSVPSEGLKSHPTSASQEESEAIQRADQGHASAVQRPHYADSQSSRSPQVPLKVSVGDPAPAPVSKSAAEDGIPDYLPPKLRQRMQSLMAELASIEDQPAEAASQPRPKDVENPVADRPTGPTELLGPPSPRFTAKGSAAEDVPAQESAVSSVDEADHTECDLIEPAPGELVELLPEPTGQPVANWEGSLSDQEIAALSELGITTVPLVGLAPDTDTMASDDVRLVDGTSDLADPVSQDSDESPNRPTTEGYSEPTPTFIPFQEISESEWDVASWSTDARHEECPPADNSITLTTARFLDPELLDSESLDDEATDGVADSHAAAAAPNAELADTTARFSQQAAEIIDILQRRQKELSYHRDQLELRQARVENEMRQQRLELIEKKRALLEEVRSFRDQQPPAAQAMETVVEPRPTNHAPQPEPTVKPSRPQRRVTLESIALERPVEPAAQETRSESQSVIDQHHSTTQEDTLEPEFLAALAAQLRQSSHRTPVAPGSPESDSGDQSGPVEHEPEAVAGSLETHSRETGRLQQKAHDLKRQHSAAVDGLRRTRRQLELLRNVMVQQQQQTAQRAADLDDQQQEWNQTRSLQLTELDGDRQEQSQLVAIRENEFSKRETYAQQRDLAIRQLEARLQQEQVEILRDRVIVRQLERTVRQTLSNSEWSERRAIIAEESEGYLRELQQKVDQLNVETNRQIKRLDSRQAELLLYRESTRNWVQRQMKLISRRSAHVEEREQQVNERLTALTQAREALHQQQMALDSLLQEGLNRIDHQLETPAPSRSDAA